MNPLELDPEACEVMEVNWVDRWQVYQRLQELEIPCWCAIDQPLRVQVNSAKQAVQLISVLKQFTASRQELWLWLEECWQKA
ncbi:MAG: Asr1405/Asl0597 family protein [Actinomycetota bacterium]